MDKQKQIAQKYYESNHISFAKLAENSQSYLGFVVTVDQLKDWSSKDGGWSKKSLNDSERAKMLSDILFDKIVEEKEDISARDLTSLANSWVQLQTKINPESMGTTNRPIMQEVRDIIAAENE